MKLLDVMTRPWAITQPVFAQIIDIYNAHIVGPKLDIAALEARAGKPLSRDRRELIGQVVDGVAVLDLEGPLAKRMSSVNAACEGTSTNLIFDFFTQAVNDPSIKGIILNIDSPGGTVDGTMDLARAVYNARGKKPIVTLVDGQMCSAACWIGSAADAVYLANETSMAGSIGVVITHVDYSEALKKAGIVATEITAGKYKRAVSSYKPLDEEGRSQLQEMADDIYTLFVDDMATFKGLSVDQVLDRMAEGRVFLGQKAIDAGLADGVSSLDALIAQLSAGQAPSSHRAGAARSTSTPNPQEATMPYTREDLDANAPDLVTAIKAEGAAEAEAQSHAKVQALTKDLETARAETSTKIETAVKAETERIQGVLEAASGLNLDVKDVHALAFDGKTTRAEASDHFLTAIKAKAPLDRIRTEASAPVPFGGTPQAPGKENPQAETNRLVTSINKRIADAAAEGRTISAADALNEIQQEA